MRKYRIVAPLVALLALLAWAPASLAQISTITPGQVKALPGSNLADPGCNQANAQAMFRFGGFYMDHYTGGNNPCNGMWSSSSVTYDVDRNQVLSIANGGHSDYSGNEVYKFPLSGSQTWSIDLAPTAFFGGSFNAGDLIPVPGASTGALFYPDPSNHYGGGDHLAARHSYQGNLYMPWLGTVWMAAGSGWGGGGGGGSVLFYDPVTKVATNQDGISAGTGISAAVDPQMQRIYYHNNDQLFYYDPALSPGSREHAVSGSEGSWTQQNTTATFDLKRRRYVMAGRATGTPFGSSTGNGLCFYDLVANPNAASIQCANIDAIVGGTMPSFNASPVSGGVFEAPGVLYDRIRDKYVIFQGHTVATANDLWVIDPDLVGGVFHATKTTYSGDPVPCTDEACDSGIGYPPWGRFLHDIVDDVYLLFPRTRLAAYAFRPLDQARATPLPKATWVGILYPLQVGDGFGVNERKMFRTGFQAGKHQHSLSDEILGRVVVANGDSNVQGVGVDSAPSSGALDIKTGTWSIVKGLTGVPTTEWQLDKTDNASFVHINNRGAFALDNVYAVSPGFSDGAGVGVFGGSISALNGTIAGGNSVTNGGYVFIGPNNFVGTLTAEESQNNGGSWTTCLFFDYDTGTTSSTLALNNPATEMYRSIISIVGIPTNFRVRASSYTSGTLTGTQQVGRSAGAVLQLVVGLDTTGNLGTSGQNGPTHHGTPLPFYQISLLNPGDGSYGSATWRAPTGWASTNPGDSNTGQGVYDPVTHAIYRFIDSPSISKFDLATGTNSFLPLTGVQAAADAVTSGGANLQATQRGYLTIDVVGRTIYFVAIYSGNSDGGLDNAHASLSYMKIDSPSTNGFVTNSSVPGYVPIEHATDLPSGFDPTNRNFGLIRVLEFGGYVYGLLTYQVDRHEWTTYPTNGSADFPGGKCLGCYVQANDLVYDTYHHAWVGFGGTGAGNFPDGTPLTAQAVKSPIFRTDGGPTVQAPAPPVTFPTGLGGNATLSGKGVIKSVPRRRRRHQLASRCNSRNGRDNRVPNMELGKAVIA